MDDKYTASRCCGGEVLFNRKRSPSSSSCWARKNWRPAVRDHTCCHNRLHWWILSPCIPCSHPAPLIVVCAAIVIRTGAAGLLVRGTRHCTFPEKWCVLPRQVALLLPDSVYGTLAVASLLTFPVVSCSRMHHNGAVLVGAAAHAMYPDMHISTDAGVEVYLASSSSLCNLGKQSCTMYLEHSQLEATVSTLWCCDGSTGAQVVDPCGVVRFRTPCAMVSNAAQHPALVSHIYMSQRTCPLYIIGYLVNASPSKFSTQM